MYCDCMSSVSDVVDQDHICWKAWKLIARTISPTHSLFVAQRPSTRGRWGNFGDTRGGVGKLVCWSTKAAISLKRAKTEEKLVWIGGPIPDPRAYGIHFTKIGGSQPPPKTLNR